MIRRKLVLIVMALAMLWLFTALTSGMSEFNPKAKGCNKQSIHYCYMP
jgi:hypothetical protein